MFGNEFAYAMTWTELKKKLTDKKSDKIEKYVGGLPNMIHRSVVASKPKTMQEATEMAIEVMDKRIRTFADRQTESKRSLRTPQGTLTTTTRKQEAEHWQSLHCRNW
ncbi:hypothetical protein Tco_0348362 [Tanacetum coccineum]